MATITGPLVLVSQGKEADTPSLEAGEAVLPYDTEKLNVNFGTLVSPDIRAIASAAMFVRIAGATDANTFSTVIMRDSAGNAKVTDPTDDAHIATKKYVDDLMSSGGVTEGDGIDITAGVVSFDPSALPIETIDDVEYVVSVVSGEPKRTNIEDFVPSSSLDTDGTLAANSDTLVPSQKAVKTYADQLIASADAMVFKGVVDCSANPNYPAADRGHTYRVSVAGKIGGGSGVNVEVGDLLLCLTDSTASGNQATVGTAWSIAQTNLDGAVIGPTSAVNNRVAFFDGVSGRLIKDSGLTLSGTNTGDQTSVSGNAGTATALQTARNINGVAFNGTADITIPVGTLSGSVALTGIILPTSLSTSQNDYNPTGLSTASQIQIDATADISITGLQGGSQGRIIILKNITSTSKFITLPYSSSSSSAANRFSTAYPHSDVVIGPQGHVILQYDTAYNVWFVIGGNPIGSVYGSAVLGSDYTVTTSFATTGLSVTLPVAGVYELDCAVRLYLVGNAGAYVLLRLYDSTNSAVVTNSECFGCYLGATGEVAFTAPITPPRVTVTWATTIRLEAIYAGTATTRLVRSDGNGRTVLRYRRVGP